MESESPTIIPNTSEGTVLSIRDKRNLASKAYKASHRDAIKVYNKTYYANKKIAKLLEASQLIDHPLVDLVKDGNNNWVRNSNTQVIDLTNDDWKTSYPLQEFADDSNNEYNREHLEYT